MSKQRGFTLIAVLVALVVLALACNGLVFVLARQAQREREARLLQAGQQFVGALKSYYEASPGSVKQLPRELGDLVEDGRFMGVRRHLREIYEDPIGRQPWTVLRRADGSVEGIASASIDAPLRTAALDLGDLHLPAATHYSEWKFVFVPAAIADGERH